MIQLTKLNGSPLVLNCDQIETVQENPDTTIRMTNGNLYIVMESSQKIIDLTIEYRRQVFRDLLTATQQRNS